MAGPEAAFDRIVVLGAGAWGTALANVAARPGRKVWLWCRDPAQAAAIRTTRENRRRLPGVPIAEAVAPTSDLGCVGAADLVLAAVPAQSLRAVLNVLPPMRPEVPIVICAKGIETGTGLLMSRILGQCLPGRPPAVLSGPSFAADVGRGRPTAVTVAAGTEAVARGLADGLARPGFRLYFTTDVEGVEIGGAAKNVLAIACGIAAGLGLGASASAALVARGFAELARYGRACGARPETLMGLSGLGDLVLTCSSLQSRNFAFGRALGLGRGVLEAAEAGLAEGAATAGVLDDLAASRGIEMPIVTAVAAILAGTLAPSMALERLLDRPARPETDLDSAW